MAGEILILRSRVSAAGSQVREFGYRYGYGYSGTGIRGSVLRGNTLGGRVAEKKCNGATAAEPRAKVQRCTARSAVGGTAD